MKIKNIEVAEAIFGYPVLNFEELSKKDLQQYLLVVKSIGAEIYMKHIQVSIRGFIDDVLRGDTSQQEYRIEKNNKFYTSIQNDINEARNRLIVLSANEDIEQPSNEIKCINN